MGGVLFGSAAAAPSSGHQRSRLQHDEQVTADEVADQHGEECRTERPRGPIPLRQRDGLESLTIGEVAKRLGLSKSGVFSRVGSREALREFWPKIFVDVAGRSGFGIGSAGLPAYNLLIEGRTQALENDVVLSMKQGNVAAPSRVVTASSTASSSAVPWCTRPPAPT